jgi:hypothetical protein
MIGMQVGQEERSHVVAHDATAGWRYRLLKALAGSLAAVHDIVGVANRHDR